MKSATIIMMCESILHDCEAGEVASTNVEYLASVEEVCLRDALEDMVLGCVVVGAQ
jgi:hypothetical protein